MALDWTIIGVGKPSFDWVARGVSDYETRLKRHCRLTRVHLRRGGYSDFEKAAGDTFRIVLDEKGHNLSTLELTQQIRDLELDGVRKVSVWIGGADGLDAGCREKADLVFSFGRATLMHELALLVWMEQQYRCYSVLSGSPYHREG